MPCHAAAINTYLSNTWNRDKVMAIFQFLPMALSEPVAQAGCQTLAKSLSNLSGMADGYRAITRTSLLFNALSCETLEAMKKPGEDAMVWRVDQLSHILHIFFCFCEHTTVLASHGVLSDKLKRMGGCTVYFWFYGLLFGVIRQCYLLTKHSGSKVAQAAGDKVIPYTQQEVNRGLIALLKLSCFLIFSLTCMPASRPQLLLDLNGPLVPIHKFLQATAPCHVELSTSVRGLLGLVASICDFY